MELAVRKDGDVTFLTASGHFETVTLPTFSERLEALISDGSKKICVNFRDLEFINSTALGYLVETGNRLAEEEGGQLVFSEPSKFFEATFRTLGLVHIFDLFESDDDAKAHFAG